MKRPTWRLRCAMFLWIYLSLCQVAKGVTLTTQTRAVKLNEKETASKELARMSCVPTSPATVCTVSLSNVNPSSPCGTCFAVYPCTTGGPTDFCLRYLPGQGFLDPRVVSRYSLTMRAADSSDQQALVVDVHINPNSPPFFDIGDFASLNIRRKLAQNQGIDIRARDLDKDSLTFSMVTVPPVEGLRIDASDNSEPEYMTATISSALDTRSLCLASLAALVYVKDDYHNDLAGPLAITLELDKENDRPIITNLNTDVYVRENESRGTIVYNLATFDKISPQPLEYSMSITPATATGAFAIDSKTNELKVEKPELLDYESFPNGFTLTIRVTDGFCESEPYLLQVKLVDMNEPPFLFPVDQTVDSCEGKVTITPRWTNVSDPDANDFIRYTSITPNDNGRFRIDEKTGIVSTTVDYDVDEPNSFPATVVNKITISDRQGETATATLTVRFEDCNDIAPAFSSAAKDYLVRDCWEPGTVVGNVLPASDKDSTFRQNNVFSYSGSAAGVEVLDSGSVVIQEKFTAGQTVTFPVYATDKGQVPGPLKSKPFWVSLYTLPCLPPPTTPDPTSGTGDNGNGNNRDRNRFRFRQRVKNDASSGFFDPNGPNLGWLIPALLLALPLFGLPCFLCWRYRGRLERCWANRRPCCPQKQRVLNARPTTPIRRLTPPPDKQGPGFIFGWWKETYRDNDYERTPNRKMLPEPSKGPEPLETNTYDVLEKEPPPVMAAPPSPTPPRQSNCQIL